MTALPYIYDDGGRAAAGYTGATGDCVTRAIAIATGVPYRTVYDRLADDMRAVAARARSARRQRWTSPRDGVPRTVYEPFLNAHGWTWTPTMTIGSGTTVHVAAGELPDTGPVIVRLSKHLSALVDGVIHDTGDPGRDGTRAVYGIFTPYWLDRWPAR